MSTAIPLSHFVDFLASAGIRREVVASEQARAAIGLAFDLYRPLKDLAVEVASGHLPDEAFDAMLARQTDAAARKHYPALIAGFRKFFRAATKKGATFAGRPREVYYAMPGGFSVRVNPELSYEIGDVLHIVKMYARSEPLDRSRIDLYCGVLADAFAPTFPAAVFAVLEVREGKLHVAAKKNLDRARRVAAVDAETYPRHRRGRR